VYVRNKQIACEKAGFKSTLHRLPADTAQAELLTLIAMLNANLTCTASSCSCRCRRASMHR
jgi:methylenetetrahydrofolate dehydrogenase (NADP+)/methenyltetrahydrofolate cyclohydrolase